MTLPISEGLSSTFNDVRRLLARLHRHGEEYRVIGLLRIRVLNIYFRGAP